MFSFINGRSLLVLFLSIQLTSCTTLFSRQSATTQSQRLDNFPTVNWPVDKPVKVYWQENMVPFVEAQTDRDCAFAIGVVHAHLRMGQMELFKRASAGRLSEAAGPFGTPEIDELLRKVDLGRAAESSFKLLSPADREWVEKYVEGINFFQANSKENPFEFRFLGYQKEIWTAKDTFRVSRLASADANWSALLSLIALRSKPGWEDIWKRVIEGSKESMPSMKGELGKLEKILSVTAKTGSNSAVVSGLRSASKSALMANDPHLGIFAPNLWVLMGYSCPSYNVVGFMLPGVPAVTLGRNKDVAWGGTYMRGISSHLFEVTNEQIVRTRVEKIHRRGWFSKTIDIKESVHGPVIYEGENPDSKKKEMIALNWVGHQPGNELGAFLASNRAKDWNSFRNGFSDFGVAGLNLTYADKSGNIGFFPAIKQPILKLPDEQDLFVKSSQNAVIGYNRTLDLPSSLNPESGYLASSNNLPVRTNPPLAYVSAQNDRTKRWNSLLSSKNSITVADLMLWQQDVFSEDSLRLNRIFVGAVKSVPVELSEYHQRLMNWDGRFDVSSIGAPAFETLAYKLADDILSKTVADTDLRERIKSSDAWRLYLERELLKLEPSKSEEIVLKAMKSTWSNVRTFKTWGDVHVQRVQTPLGVIPLLGRRFQYGEFPSPGSSSTVNKAAFTPGFGKRSVTFGAQSRHISDMKSEDENYFVMLGGNDGWLDNPSLTDQVEIWRKGEYLKIPLSLKGIKGRFTTRVIEIESSTESTKQSR